MDLLCSNVKLFSNLIFHFRLTSSKKLWTTWIRTTINWRWELKDYSMKMRTWKTSNYISRLRKIYVSIYENLKSRLYTLIILTFCRVKKKETDLLNSMDRANALEEELRNLGNKLSRTEDEHRRTQDQLRVNI